MDDVGTTEGFDCLLFVLLLVSTVNGVCQEGWWGPNCDMQCHCALNSYCQVNGSCQVNEPCQDGLFGPSCQYVNLLYEEGLPSIPKFLKDNDDNTCNPDRKAKTVVISLRNEISFTWLRLIVDDANLHLEDVKLKLNSQSEGCPAKKWTIVNQIVDIVCNGSLQGNTLTIEEPLAPHLCSVYFSGGRNLAIRQNVTMSSIMHAGDERFSVDGFLTHSSDYTPCSHTTHTRRPGTWMLSFRTECVISRVQIVTLPEWMNRLAGVSVQIHSFNMTALETYNGPDTVVGNILDIQFQSLAPVKYLTIRAGTGKGVDGRLSLCEVGAFGDSICPKGMYGFDCDKPCTCNKLEVCYSVTGGCLSGCQRGFVGAECDQNCPVNCENSTCSATTGRCYRCNNGYEGDKCTERCPKGLHGINCSMTCSGRCAGHECDSVTGNCDRCSIGHGGPLCDVCQQGRFGNNCSGICPVNCDRSMCDHISGNCRNCSANFRGIRCTDCVSGKYGTSCKQDCPVNCNKRLCHEVTGACIKCATGYQGNTCTATQGSEQNLLWLFLLFAIIPISFGVVAFCKRRAKLKSEEQVQTPTIDSSSSLGTEVTVSDSTVDG